MPNMKLITLGIVVFLVACSNKSVYEGLKESNRQECNKMTEYERQQCLSAVNQNYEDYEREREALKKSTEK